MLDTKEFVLSTGVRTFEAAAFLKGKGADTVAVKRLFSNSIESNRKRSEIISAAHIYRGCAIACTAPGTENARLLSAQAADELLEVSGVKASFVIFDSGNDSVNISARSYGDLNVQIIMEYLGGGGSAHRCEYGGGKVEALRSDRRQISPHRRRRANPDFVIFLKLTRIYRRAACMVRRPRRTDAA